MIQMIIGIVVIVCIIGIISFVLSIIRGILKFLWDNIGVIITLIVIGGVFMYFKQAEQPLAFLGNSVNNIKNGIWSFVYENTIFNGIWIHLLIMLCTWIIVSLVFSIFTGNSSRMLITSACSIVALVTALALRTDEFGTFGLFLEMILSVSILRIYCINIRKKIGLVDEIEEVLLHIEKDTLQVAVLTIVSVSQFVIKNANSFFNTHIPYFWVTEVIILYILIKELKWYYHTFRGYWFLKKYMKKAQLFHYEDFSKSEQLDYLNNQEEYITSVINLLIRKKCMYLLPMGNRLYMNRSLYRYFEKSITLNKTSKEIADRMNIDLKQYSFDDIYKLMFYMVKGFEMDFKENKDVKAKKIAQGDVSTVEFSNMRYSIEKHPVLLEDEEIREKYIAALNYLVRNNNINNELWDVKLAEFCKVFAVPPTIAYEGKEAVEFFSKVIKKREGLLKIVKKDYSYLLLLESVYFENLLSNNPLSYQKIEDNFETLRIKRIHRDFIYKYIKHMYLEGEIDKAECLLENTIEFNSTIKFNCREVLEYVHYNVMNDERYVILPQYHVAVCATMSAGKSTFINALLGMDFIPAKNEACTAKVTTIRNNDNINKLIGYYVRKDGSKVYSNSIDGSVLEKWNGDADVEETILEGNMEEISCDKGILVMHDTPGTNNSADTSHHDKTIEFLKSKDSNLIIYLINAEYISAKDSEILLKEIQEIHKNRKTQFVFALNKIDCFDDGGDESLIDIMQRLKEQLVDYGFVNPSIFPMSANAARLFKLVIKGKELSRREKRNLRNLFEYFSSMNAMDAILNVNTSMLKKVLESKEIKNDRVITIDDDEYSYAQIIKALHNTGVPALEAWLSQCID